MHAVEMSEVSSEFAQCWNAAGSHIQSQSGGDLKSWLKVTLTPPFLEHLSFRMGNQLFFIRIEDVEGRLETPGGPDGLRSIADGCNGHACLMPMVRTRLGWTPHAAGWGLIDADTGLPIDPLGLVSDELIEMTDWEVQDFAVQVVRDRLISDGFELMSWQGNPSVNPSIWFVGPEGPEWVVVRPARYPQVRAEFPGNIEAIAAECAHISIRGNFASVACANLENAPDAPKAPALPLWRGHGIDIQYEGLEPWRG